MNMNWKFYSNTSKYDFIVFSIKNHNFYLLLPLWSINYQNDIQTSDIPIYLFMPSFHAMCIAHIFSCFSREQKDKVLCVVHFVVDCVPCAFLFYCCKSVYSIDSTHKACLSWNNIAIPFPTIKMPSKWSPKSSIQSECHAINQIICDRLNGIFITISQFSIKHDSAWLPSWLNA